MVLGLGDSVALSSGHRRAKVSSVGHLGLCGCPFQGHVFQPWVLLGDQSSRVSVPLPSPTLSL